jgi:hypothetical protein
VEMVPRSRSSRRAGRAADSMEDRPLVVGAWRLACGL